MKKEKYLVERNGELLGDTHKGGIYLLEREEMDKREKKVEISKLEKVYNIITCPHCKELIGITSRDIRVVEEEEEIPLYLGDCCECKFCERLDKPLKIEATTYVAICVIQGNVNAIMFSEKELKEKENFCADGFGVKRDNPKEPHCFAFKKWEI